MKSIYDFTVKDIKGEDFSFSDYKGYTILIVNTASKCGLKGQLFDLEELYQKNKDNKFLVVSFPSRDFLRQEEEKRENVEQVCRLKFKTTFPIMDIVKVNGKEQIDLYKFLKEVFPGRIKWNYTKFLVDKNGNIVQRYEPRFNVHDIQKDIDKII